MNYCSNELITPGVHLLDASQAPTVVCLFPSTVGMTHITCGISLVGPLPDPFRKVGLVRGGREAPLVFSILARGSFSLSPLMRLKALYLASLMSQVLKPYCKQTNDVTAGTSTSSDVSDRNAITCLCTASASNNEGLHLALSKKQDVKSHPVRE